jgi:hypothetical protein
MHRDVTPTSRSRARLWTAEADAYRGVAAAYRRIPMWVALAGGVLLTALIAAITHTVNGNPATVATSAAVTAGLATAAHLSLRRPDIAATIIVLLAATAFAPPVALAYASGASRGITDPTSAIATLVITYALIALFAHRTSRGRAWITTLLAVGAVMLVGPFLLLLHPPLGFGWAWLAATTVLWLRGGGTTWVRDLRHRFARDYHAAVAEETVETNRAAACAATAAILDDLPAGYTTFHGRRTPRVNKRESHRVDHLVVGPTGLTVITTHAFKGRVIDDPDHGLVHDAANPVDISGLLNDADVLASIVATRTKLGWLPVRQITVIHDAVLPAKRSRVGLVAVSGKTLGVITVMSPDMLLDHVTDTENRLDHAPLDDKQVAQAVARIDRLCPPHRHGAGKQRARGPIAAYRADMVVMDNDGNRRIPTPRAPRPMFETSNNPFTVTDGQQVCLLTDEGVFDGYHIAGDPVLGDDGITRVPVLDETIDLTAHRSTGADALPLLWMPFDSIQPLTRS